jgi:hypothetical protein
VDRGVLIWARCFLCLDALAMLLLPDVGFFNLFAEEAEDGVSGGVLGEFPLTVEAVEPVLDHVFGARLAHGLGDLGPLEAELVDEAEEADVLGGGPLALLDLRVEVVQPHLAAVVHAAEVLPIGALEELEGHAAPVDVALRSGLPHDLSEDAHFALLPVVVQPLVLLVDQQLQLVLDEAEALRLEDILELLGHLQRLRGG